ncbi:hypothetical protein COCOBI_06-6100 [Coccomyxa sp. Obi]|nr:hypothetical protein COCOBI_06-6100 [Coccomyxa sp. Obi]
MSAALEGGAARLEAMGNAAPDAPPEPADIQDIIDDMQSGDQPEPEQAQQESHPPDQAQPGENPPDQAQQGGTPPNQVQHGGDPPKQANADAS